MSFFEFEGKKKAFLEVTAHERFIFLQIFETLINGTHCVRLTPGYYDCQDTTDFV